MTTATARSATSGPGVCDDEVRIQVEAAHDLGDVLADELDELEDEAFDSDEAE